MVIVTMELNMLHEYLGHFWQESSSSEALWIFFLFVLLSSCTYVLLTKLEVMMAFY